MGVLSPCPAPASSAIYSFRVGSLPIMRPPFVSLKRTCRLRHISLSQKGAADQPRTCRLRHISLSQKGATDQPCESNPGDDVPPESETLRIYRESVEKFEKEYSAALRALHGPKKKKKDPLTISEQKLFHHEANTIDGYIKEIESGTCFLYGEGTRLARGLCYSAGQATDLASKIMAYAGLRSHHPSEISLETIEQTIRTYVSTFVKVAEDTCHRKADQATIILFLRALGGACAISHILFEDAFFAANNIEGNSSKYIPYGDAGASNRIFQQKMTELEDNIRNSSPVKAREIMWSTLFDARFHAHFFVMEMTIRRKKAIAYVMENSNKASNAGTGDRETDASSETGP